MSLSRDDGRRVKVTDVVECYENGKTFECVCGQGFGVEYGIRVVKCPTCNAAVIDEKSGSREYTKPTGQTSLGDWV